MFIDLGGRELKSMGKIEEDKIRATVTQPSQALRLRVIRGSQNSEKVYLCLPPPPSKHLSGLEVSFMTGFNLQGALQCCLCLAEVSPLRRSLYGCTQGTPQFKTTHICCLTVSVGQKSGHDLAGFPTLGVTRLLLLPHQRLTREELA